MIDKLPYMIRDRNFWGYSRETIGEHQLVKMINNIPQDQLLLDYGSGKGEFIKELRQIQEIGGEIRNDIKILGVDRYAHILKSFGSVTSVFGELPIKSSSVGLAMAVYSLGYYAENETQLREDFKELFRILSPEGNALLVLDPNPGDWEPDLYYKYKSDFDFPSTKLGKSGIHRLERMSTEELWTTDLIRIWENCGLSAKWRGLGKQNTHHNLLAILQKTAKY